MSGYWDCYAHAGRHHNVSPRDLLSEMDRCGIARAVLTPFMDAPAFDDLLAAAQALPSRFQAVCRFDVRAGFVDPRPLEKLLASGFIGARIALPQYGSHQPEMEAALSALDSQAKVLVAHAPDGIGLHARQIVEWVNRFPRLRVFIPHLGWPRAGQAAPTDGWAEGIQVMAGCQRIYMGLSALYHFSQTTPPFPDTHGFVRIVLQLFGPARCVLAGDYPVGLSRCSYAQTWECLAQAVGDDSALKVMWAETPRVLWGCP